MTTATIPLNGDRARRIRVLAGDETNARGPREQEHVRPERSPRQGDGARFVLACGGGRVSRRTCHTPAQARDELTELAAGLECFPELDHRTIRYHLV